MTICCDKPLLTPFCPLCGKPNRDPLLEIATWFREQADRALRSAEVRSNSDSEHSRKVVGTYTRKAKKFMAWADHLTEIHRKDIGQ